MLLFLPLLVFNGFPQLIEHALLLFIIEYHRRLLIWRSYPQRIQTRSINFIKAFEWIRLINALSHFFAMELRCLWTRLLRLQHSLSSFPTLLQFLCIHPGVLQAHDLAILILVLIRSRSANVLVELMVHVHGSSAYWILHFILRYDLDAQFAYCVLAWRLMREQLSMRRWNYSSCVVVGSALLECLGCLCLVSELVWSDWLFWRTMIVPGVFHII